ncbi:MAG TPA: hypothetical protein VNX21_03725 [Candidatus Thermoplasmatota archaeon]|nr:hypothetical protein [Candidatus Thermoplasmatota archaeon]
MSDEIDFTAERGDQYLKLEEGVTYYLTFVERLEDHEEFKLGKGKNAKPAPVYRAQQRDGKFVRLSVTSTQLAASLDKAAAHFGGSFLGRRLKITPEGDGTERLYKVRAVAEPKGEQTALTAGA